MTYLISEWTLNLHFLVFFQSTQMSVMINISIQFVVFLGLYWVGLRLNSLYDSVKVDIEIIKSVKSNLFRGVDGSSNIITNRHEPIESH